MSQTKARATNVPLPDAADYPEIPEHHRTTQSTILDVCQTIV